MPARSFFIFLLNESGFDLARQPSQAVLEGIFTSADLTPPATIANGAEKGWQSESDGVLQGTEGWETYQIMDGTQTPDQLRLHWVNPWWGSTEAHPTIMTMTTAAPTFDARVPANHFDAGRLADDEQSVSANFTLEVLLPHANGNSVSTSRWYEIIPGYVFLPIPAGPIDHAVVNFRVTQNKQPASIIVPSFGSQAGARSFAFVPAQNAPGDAWIGAFAFPSGQISSAEIGVTIAAGSQPSRTAFIGARYHVTATEKPASGTGSTVNINQDVVGGSTGTTTVYIGNVWPPRARQSNSPVLVNPVPWRSTMTRVSAAAPSASLGLSPQAGLRSTVSETASTATTSAAFTPIQNSNLSLSEHLAQQSTLANFLETADTLSLPLGVTLMLYSFHLTDGQPLGYSLRYLRRSSNNEVLVDAMLLPALEEIH